MNHANAPVVKDLVLVGGGHSHVAVLKSFGMNPMPGVRVTLISKDVLTPYSGMLPGLIAGHYSREQAHIDLRPLCHFAGARFFQGTVSGFDLAAKKVLVKDRPPVCFDLLSINTGSTPQTESIPGAREHTLPVKPIDRFLQGWQGVVERIREHKAGRFRVVVVGGGAGGVEVALSLQYRLGKGFGGENNSPGQVEFHLVSAASTLLPTHNARVQSKFARILSERGIHQHLGERVARVEPGLLHCASGNCIEGDAFIWVISASAPQWPAQAGLRTDEEGFILVNDFLQSVSHPDVFAAGDVAAMEGHPRPKSGVFAVRQGPPLAENLRRALAGQPLKSFVPQRQFLSLVSTGNQYAVASRGPLAVEGVWVWKWKDWIDRRWMARYQELPEMTVTDSTLPQVAHGLASAEVVQQLAAAPMRCGGCGAKVGSTVLSRVQRRLEGESREGVLIGLDAPDDAAVTMVPPGKALVQTVDFFRSFLDDPYLFGRIAANHCLGDIHAMGAEPHSALAMAMLPFGLEEKMEEQLYQMMAGATSVLREHNAALLGGHTAEGAELAFGLSVNGHADPDKLLRKGGMKQGDVLVLTKPLGTGTLLAADMRRKAKGKWIEAAIVSMLQSSANASACFLRHGATACTDVTGFGLLGHLLEMARASKTDVEIHLNGLPALEGALETISSGILSSMQPQNLRLRRAIRNAEAVSADPRFALMFDPQTAGGLLAAVPRDRAQDCLEELRRIGSPHASIIGRVAAVAEDPAIVLKSEPT